ncbi:MAG: methanogenesis marker 9 domain-containing protein [Methanoregulaceae archaeon]
MTDASNKYGIILNGRAVKTPIAIASMAGVVDASYVLARAPHIGAAFIGGYSVDGKTIAASREMVKAGREEFISDDIIGEVKRQVALLATSDIVTGLNFRASSPSACKELAAAIGPSVIYEIDAHCRQEPMIEAGAGEYLVKHTDELKAMVRALKMSGVAVSVKFRAGVSADDRLLSRKLWRAGADILHIDLMDLGHTKVRQIRNSCPLTIIANNSITSFERMKEMLSHGADMVSLARESNERTLAGLDAALSRYTEEHGWYNSPKQLCRGGDLRALAFCCMPVKECPLLPTLERLGIPKDEYLQLKMNAVKGTPIENGKQTCFGSLAWCCKDSSPCMFRDMTLQEMGLKASVYMNLKRDLSKVLMKRIFHEVPEDDAR